MVNEKSKEISKFGISLVKVNYHKQVVVNVEEENLMDSFDTITKEIKPVKNAIAY